MKYKFIRVMRECQEEKIASHNLTFSFYLSHFFGRFDLTKVPDIYDMIRFDVLHNSHLEVSVDNNQRTQRFRNDLVNELIYLAMCDRT